MREIGSEFHFETFGKSNDLEFYDIFSTKNSSQIEYTYSGRTALDLIIQELDKSIRKVLIPRYCCASMVQPFIDNGFIINFYDVNFQENHLIINIDENTVNSIIIDIGYFGYKKLYNLNSSIKNLYKKNIIIRDDTHNIFGNFDLNDAHYSIVSLRKWMPIASGATVIKHNTSFSNNYKLEDSDNLVLEKIKAMKMKKEYLVGQRNDKTFMNSFINFNQTFSNHYKNKSIDSYSLEFLENYDFQKMINIRKENASYLHKELSSLENVKILTDFNYNTDTPLFVPIQVSYRNDIRNHFRKEDIFLPIHWPVPEVMDRNDIPYIYKSELSLICDQRYNLIDMSRIVKILKESIR